jgi:hypothetical protein
MENRKVINSFQRNLLTSLQYELRHNSGNNEQVIAWLQTRIKELEESGTWLR